MANEAQAKLWTETIGQVWIDNEERILAIGASHGRAALDAAAIAPDERVLDVGCGTGPMTIAIADLVGLSGSVVGVDISPLLIEHAQRRAEGRVNVSFTVADAQTADLGSDFDVVYSQFGVMFFEDPVAAFANLHRTMKARGRLAFSCWQPFFNNPWMSAPAMGAMSVFPMEPPDPNTPGPFALGDPDRLRSILTDAGFADLAINAYEDVATVRMDEPDMDQVLSMGPMREAYAVADRATRERAFAAVLEAVAGFANGDRYRFPSASWTVTARA